MPLPAQVCCGMIILPLILPSLIGAPNPVLGEDRDGSVDAEVISKAAVKLITEHGVEGFSIRAVARSLGVTPMALYYHVRDKAELAELVVDSVFADHPLGAPTGDWREDLWSVAKCSRGIALANPAIAIIRSIYDIWTAQSHQMAGRWMRHWLESGLEREYAVLAAATNSWRRSPGSERTRADDCARNLGTAGVGAADPARYAAIRADPTSG